MIQTFAYGPDFNKNTVLGKNTKVCENENENESKDIKMIVH